MCERDLSGDSMIAVVHTIWVGAFVANVSCVQNLLDPIQQRLKSLNKESRCLGRRGRQPRLMIPQATDHLIIYTVRVRHQTYSHNRLRFL